MAIQFGNSIPFAMFATGSNIPVAGLSITVKIAKEGGSLAVPFGSINEIGGGAYRISANVHDTDTPGSLVLAATAPGCDPTIQTYEILPKDHPRDMRKTESLLADIIDQNDTLIKRNY